MVELAMAGRRRGYGLDEGPDRESAPAGTEGGSARRSQPTTAQAELSDLVPGPRARLVPCLHLLGLVIWRLALVRAGPEAAGRSL